MNVRRLGPTDLEVVLTIQCSSLEAAQWSRASYEAVAHGKFYGWVAERDGEVMGFLVARLAGDELEILNVAVDPAARRQGVGSRLLEVALEASRERGARWAFLEVRASNSAAIGFYERHRFVLSGRRPEYYSAPREDGLVLSRGLT